MQDTPERSKADEIKGGERMNWIDWLDLARAKSHTLAIPNLSNEAKLFMILIGLVFTLVLAVRDGWKIRR